MKTRYFEGDPYGQAPQKKVAPAAERNKDAILDVLRRTLPHAGMVLEVASGTGQHAVHFAANLPYPILWQTSEPDAELRRSISAWIEDAALDNVLPPLNLDVTAKHWPIDRVQAVVCINLIHISAWDATVGLLRGAGRILEEDGVLIVYGPFLIDGSHTAPSNASFDQSLRAQNSEWGVRDLADISAQAEKHGLMLEDKIAMPANNFSLIYRKQSPSRT